MKVITLKEKYCKNFSKKIAKTIDEFMIMDYNGINGGA